MPAAKIIVFILLLMVFVTLSVQNMGLVSVIYYDLQFHKQNFETPLLLVVLVSLLMGFALAWMVGALKQMRLKSKLRKSDKIIQSLKSKIEKINSDV